MDKARGKMVGCKAAVVCTPQWRNFKCRVLLQEKSFGPLVPNNMNFLLVGPKNRGAVAGLENGFKNPRFLSFFNLKNLKSEM